MLRKTLALCFLACLLLVSVGDAAEPSTTADVEVWYGNSGATPAPVQDSARLNHWWWPREPKSNIGDKELWGNRGVAYSQWRDSAKDIKEEQPKPPPQKLHPESNIDYAPPMPYAVLFDFDSAELSEGARTAVAHNVEGLLKHPLVMLDVDSVILVGYTCDVGSESYNLELGIRRAQAVKEEMVKLGLNGEIIRVISVGESKQVPDNDGMLGRRINRRVSFHICVDCKNIHQKGCPTIRKLQEK